MYFNIVMNLFIAYLCCSCNEKDSGTTKQISKSGPCEEEGGAMAWRGKERQEFPLHLQEALSHEQEQYQ